MTSEGVGVPSRRPYRTATATPRPEVGPAGTPVLRPWRSIAAFGLLAVALVAGGHAYYVSEAAAIRTARHAEIAAIAELKVAEIQHWRKERLVDAALVAGDPSIREGLRELLRPSAGARPPRG